ncbi:hypothetical protein Tco_0525969 [Tanacetum coccineum]
MMERELGEGYSFIKKKCFVCGSLSHLIKDCDYYEKKMAREAEVKKQRVVNTGNGVAKPFWTNVNRVNHANKLVPRSVQLNAGRTNINSVRSNINTGRTNINPVRPRVNTGSSNVNTVRTRQSVPTKTSNSFSPKRPQDHPLKNMVDRGIFDSGCSGHMIGNKDQLEDFEEFNGGSVTFGGSKGYISGKGKIRVEKSKDLECFEELKSTNEGSFGLILKRKKQKARGGILNVNMLGAVIQFSTDSLRVLVPSPDRRIEGECAWKGSLLLKIMSEKDVECVQKHVGQETSGEIEMWMLQLLKMDGVRSWTLGNNEGLCKSGLPKDHMVFQLTIRVQVLELKWGQIVHGLCTFIGGQEGLLLQRILQLVSEQRVDLYLILVVD